MSSTAVLPSPRQTTRFTHHHVGDRPARRLAKLICSIFLSLLFAAALLLFFLFLILRPHRPRFHITSFSLTPSAVSLNISIRNPNREIGIHYDSMSGSAYYKDDRVAAFDRLLMPFYQPKKNTTAVTGNAAVEAGEATLEQIAADATKAGRVRFRLELRSTVRFRVTIWDTHRHGMHVSCNLEVGADGNLVAEFKDKRCPIYFV